MFDLNPSPRLYTRLIAVWIILSVAGITVALVTWQTLDTSFNESGRLRQLRRALEDAQDAVQDAESAQRGFLLTNETVYLKPFHAAERNLPSRLDRLGALAQIDPEINKTVGELHRLVDQKMAELHHTITVQQETGPAQALVMVRTGEGLALMNRIRDLLDRFDQRLRTIGIERSDRTDAQLRYALITTLVGGIVGLGAGLLALYLSQLASRQEERSRGFAEELIRVERGALQKSSFLANMSHEIRTPMTAILGFSELLTNDLAETSKSLHYARSIRQSALALLQLINDILDVAKLDVGMVVLHLEPVDPQDVLDFVTTIFSQQMALKSLNFRITQGPGIPRSLLLDRSRLRQILINLVNNALKFTEMGDVTVHAEWEPDFTDRSHGTLLFEVIDTGIGIPPEKWESIFEPFFQVDSLPSTERLGSGLGLSIVQRLAERMGGSIALKTSSDKGTTFLLRLPNVAISERTPASLNELPARVDFNDLAAATILVVDDNPLTRELVGEMFHGTHHIVYFTTNARDAVESVRNREPDVVLMDLSMPSLDASRVREEIRQISGAEAIAVIAITGSSERNEEVALKGAFSNYLRKPYTRRALFETLVDFLGRRLSVASPIVPEPSAPAGPLAERWSHLVETLHRFETSRWPAVREGGAINETKAFAQELADLGRANQCSPLVAYAEAMTRAADDYAVLQLETQLNEFPGLIVTIAREADPTLA